MPFADRAGSRRRWSGRASNRPARRKPKSNRRLQSPPCRRPVDPIMTPPPRENRKLGFHAENEGSGLAARRGAPAVGRKLPPVRDESMQSKKMFLAMILALATTGSVALAPCRADSDVSQADEARDNQKQAVEHAAFEFYAALNALFTGDVAPMQQVWSHADDVSYMGPVGGFQIGWRNVNDRWEEQAALHLGGKIEPRDIQIVVGDELASVQCLEVGNNLEAEIRPLHVSIRATSLFRRENGQWKMISHHTDLLPFLEKEPPLTSGDE